MTSLRPWPVLLMVRTLSQGGTERQVSQLARSLDRAVFHAHVACFLGEGFRADDLRTAGVPILEMPMRSFFSVDSPRAMLALDRYVRRQRIRLIHTFDYPMNVFGIPAGRLLRVPVVLSSQRSHRSLIPPRYRPFVRLSDRLAHGIVVNCEAVRRHLIEDYSVPAHKIHLCYNALDTERFHPGPRQRPPELRGASLVIGVVCVLRAAKGLPTLLEAFAQIYARCPGLRLLFVGSGDERDALRERSRQLAIAEACVFQPSVQDVTPWLGAIDIFVLPSVTEAFSNSLMEAMACGCCPIASRVGGNPELVRHGETGLLIEQGNAADLARQLLAVVGDSELRQRLAKNAAAWVRKEFALTHAAGCMQSIYENFLSRV